MLVFIFVFFYIFNIRLFYGASFIIGGWYLLSNIGFMYNQGVYVLNVCSGSLLPLISNACYIFFAMNLQFYVISDIPETPLSKFFFV